MASRRSHPHRRHQNHQKPGPEALTSIHGAYTLAATNEPETNEAEELMARHFVETLAEVALSVASRKLAEQEQPR